MSRGPINVELRGYLDFFGLKNGGMNPQRPNADIAPTMDLQRWYMESRATSHSFNMTAIAATANPSNDSIVSTTPALPTSGGVVRVPQSEVWLLLPGTNLFVQTSANAGTSFPSFDLAHSPGSRLNIVPMTGFAPVNASVAGTILSFTRQLEEPYWIGSGHIMFVRSNGIVVGAGATATAQGMLKVLRLQV